MTNISTASEHGMESASDSSVRLRREERLNVGMTIDISMLARYRDETHSSKI
jgi:hypothetical protein